MFVNLGIDMPTLARNYVPEGNDIELHSDHGLMGTDPYPMFGEVDTDFVNTGKETVTALPGASTFGSSDGFNIIRGGICVSPFWVDCNAVPLVIWQAVIFFYGLIYI
jgi:3-oxoacid CoA-transferase B subunit